MSRNFDMTPEERLVLKLKTWDRSSRITLNHLEVRILVRRMGLSPLRVARDFQVTTKGSQELGKWAMIYGARDLAMFLYPTSVIIYSIVKHLM